MIGAAPVTHSLIRPPNRLRIFESTCLSANSYCFCRRKPGRLPARSTSRIRLPTPIAHQKIRFFRPPSLSTAEVAVA